MLNCALCGNKVLLDDSFLAFSKLPKMAQAFGIISLLALAGLIGTLCCSFDAQSRWLLLTSHLVCLLSVPNLALILLLDPESRASNKGNPGSRKIYWGPS